MISSVFFKYNLARQIKKIKNQQQGLAKLASHALLHKSLILLLTSFFLALLLIPRTVIQLPDYNVDAIATGNIKADRDFRVEEKVASAQKQMETVNNIPSVYDHDSQVMNKVLLNLTNAFSLMRDIISQQKNTPGGDKALLSTLKKDFESIVGVTLSSEEFQSLYHQKFSDSLASIIASLITSTYHSGMITNVTFLQQEKYRGIVIRDVRRQEEKEISKLTDIHHITDIEEIMKKSLANHGRGKPNIDQPILTMAVKLIRPNLIFNQNITESRKQEASKDLKPVFVKVQKNEMLVREGEKITPAVMAKLEAYYLLKGERRLSRFIFFTGLFFIISLLGVILYYHTDRAIKNNLTDIAFLSIAAIIQIILVRMGIFISQAITEAFPAIPAEIFIYFIPFGICSILVSLLLNRNAALLFSIFLSILVTFLFDNKISLFVYSFLGSIAASYRIAGCHERAVFFKTGLFLGIINVCTILFLGLIYESIFNLNTFVALLMGLGGGIITGLIVAGLLPIFESIFQYTTDIKLLELANLNKPIFQKMIMEAPGTYHHSIVVASMVEAAAESIGANPLLAKVSAYYHDIGKMKKPQYFIENQLPSENRHDKLSPKMSSLVIISHVKDGYEMAVKAKLGREIAHIIKQHHGTGLVNYFFDKAKKDKDPSIRSLPESDFRYPGPKPQTREAGLVLLGDILEASSRTLTNPTPARIMTLVRERIESVFSDGQLDECELTLQDLNKMTESFTMILNGIFHHRISYPESYAAEGNGDRKEGQHATLDRKPAEKSNGRSPETAAGSA